MVDFFCGTLKVFHRYSCYLRRYNLKLKALNIFQIDSNQGRNHFELANISCKILKQHFRLVQQYFRIYQSSLKSSMLSGFFTGGGESGSGAAMASISAINPCSSASFASISAFKSCSSANLACISATSCSA